MYTFPVPFLMFTAVEVNYEQIGEGTGVLCASGDAVSFAEKLSQYADFLSGNYHDPYQEYLDAQNAKAGQKNAENMRKAAKSGRTAVIEMREVITREATDDTREAKLLYALLVDTDPNSMAQRRFWRARGQLANGNYIKTFEADRIAFKNMDDFVNNAILIEDY
jgi:hypothetical protein